MDEDRDQIYERETNFYVRVRGSRKIKLSSRNIFVSVSVKILYYSLKLKKEEVYPTFILQFINNKQFV